MGTYHGYMECTMDMEQMMRRMAAQRDKPTAISGEEAAKYRAEFVHIENLQPGDKVRWKGKEFASSSIPEVLDVIEVARVGEPGTIGVRGEAGSPYACQMLDFTAFFRSLEGDVVEYAFDSRRFERVE